MKLEYTISQDAAGQRLDKFLRRRLAEMPLSHLYKMVRTKKVRVNGGRADIAQLLQPGDVVVVHGAREANPEAARKLVSAGEYARDAGPTHRGRAAPPAAGAPRRCPVPFARR